MSSLWSPTQRPQIHQEILDMLVARAWIFGQRLADHPFQFERQPGAQRRQRLRVLVENGMHHRWFAIAAKGWPANIS